MNHNEAHTHPCCLIYDVTPIIPRINGSRLRKISPGKKSTDSHCRSSFILNQRYSRLNLFLIRIYISIHMDAYRLLVSAPVKEMFDTYMERVHSRGELGVLSSLNQRVWREYNDLKIYLENKIKEK